MQVVVVKVHFAALAQVMSLLQFSYRVRVSANELTPGLLAHFFLQNSGETEVKEDPSLEVWTPIHVFGFHIPVYYFERVHFLHAFEESFIFIVGRSIAATTLHGELDSIVIANDVIAEEIGDLGASL